jgi:hypothetical protein
MRSFSMVVVVLFAGIALCGQASAEVGVPAGTVQAPRRKRGVS